MNFSNEYSYFYWYSVHPKNKEEIVDLMINKGAKVEFKHRKSGNTILHALARLPDTPKTLSLITKFVEAGLLIDSTNSKIETPLQIAVVAQRKETVRLLKDFGADINFIGTNYFFLLILF